MIFLNLLSYLLVQEKKIPVCPHCFAEVCPDFLDAKTPSNSSPGGLCEMQVATERDRKPGAAAWPPACGSHSNSLPVQG